MKILLYVIVFVLGFVVGEVVTSAVRRRWPRHPWARLRGHVREGWSRRFGDYARRERAALPDGTRVRLVCGPGCQFKNHDGVWTTSWTPRRNNDIDDPDDYRLTREGGRRDHLRDSRRDPAGLAMTKEEALDEAAELLGADPSAYALCWNCDQHDQASGVFEFSPERIVMCLGCGGIFYKGVDIRGEEAA